MARLPQIPGIDYGGKPGAPVERAVLPNVDGGMDAVREGANAVEQFADVRQKAVNEQQNQLDQIAAAKQRILDTTTAARAAGDFEEKLRAQSRQLQQQYVDEPDKAAPEFLKNARQLADATIKSATNSEVGLSLSRKTEASISESMKSLDTWASLRATQKAKSDLTVMVNQASRGAEDQYSPAQLASYAASKHKELDPLLDNLTGNGEKAKSHLDNEIAKAWVVAAGARDPVNTLRALDSKEGFLVDNLTTEERKTLRAQAETSFQGMGKLKQMQVLKEGIDQTGQAYNLFRTGELTSGAIYSMQRANDQKKLAISLNPNMDEGSRAAQLKNIDLQTSTLRALDIANRKQSGFDPEPDENMRGKILEKFDGLFKQDNGSSSKDLASIVQFRHDLAQAYSDNKISRADLDRMDKGVALALPRAMTAETRKTGWAFAGFAWRNPRESGNAALNELVDPKHGTFPNLSDKQRNDARMLYVEQLNDAAENGHPVTEQATQAMARKAVYFAAGKRLPQ